MRTGSAGGRRKMSAGVIYLGHIPFGFFEDQIWQYFSQFGDLECVRLSRNPRTGKSRHYAYIKFKDSDVATVAAEAMDKYMMFGQTLQCRVVPAKEVHDMMFVGPGVLRHAPEVSEHTIRQQTVIKARRYAGGGKDNEQESVKTEEEKRAMHVQREIAKMKKMKELGIDYKHPYANVLEGNEA